MPNEKLTNKGENRIHHITRLQDLRSNERDDNQSEKGLLQYLRQHKHTLTLLSMNIWVLN